MGTHIGSAGLAGRNQDISLLQLLGKPQRDDIWILDLSTMEGAAFSSRGGIAEADIAKRKANLCPVMPLFLKWLRQQPMGPDFPPQPARLRVRS